MAASGPGVIPGRYHWPGRAPRYDRRPLPKATITAVSGHLATKRLCVARELPAQPPVAANQPTFGAPNTNTMGAMQG